MRKKTLGIVGGVGPLATMFIGEMIVRRTKAEKDQDHVNAVITNNTAIPDRTAFIMGQSNDNPVPVMIGDIEKLTLIGAEIIIIPCNTAHTFFDEFEQASPVPVIHMIRETMKRATEQGAKKVGILATTGTVTSKVYQQAAIEYGLEPVVPNHDMQENIMSIIYDNIKAGKNVDKEKWLKIVNYMENQNCDRIVLGCTELSIVKKDMALSEYYLDSLIVLAETAILSCGYELAE